MSFDSEALLQRMESIGYDLIYFSEFCIYYKQAQYLCVLFFLKISHRSTRVFFLTDLM